MIPKMIQKTKSFAKTAYRRGPGVLLLVLIAGLALAATLSWRINPLPERAAGYAQQVAIASAGIYVALRTVNAFLSTAQEVEIGGSLAVSANIQPLKTLEPIDDTIERITSLIFTTMVFTGLLAVALGPVSAVGSALIFGALALWIADRLIGRQDLTIVVMARQLSWYGAFLAIALPGAFFLSSLFADSLTQQVWTKNHDTIKEITAPIDVKDSDMDGGLWEFVEIVDNYSELARNIYEQADDLIASYIAILSVFLFKIIILPPILFGAFFIATRFFARQIVEYWHQVVLYVPATAGD